MSGFTKLFSSIVTSTIWCEDYPVRLVWISMLALSDAHGVVEGSIPGFARIANVQVKEMERAIKVLSDPDPNSRTPDNEGRRVEPIEGGWRILNYKKYREQGQAQDGSRAPYMREWRERKRNALHDGVTRSTEAEAEAEAEAEHRTPQSPKPGDCPPSEFKDQEKGQLPGLHNERKGTQEAIPCVKTGSCVSPHPKNQKKVVSSPSTRFQKPSPHEVAAYASSIGFKLDGSRFCDHYEARGWRYNGNVAMKDWKAAVRTWKSRNHGGGFGAGEQKLSQPAGRDALAEVRRLRENPFGDAK